jgi:hypothetical protein
MAKALYMRLSPVCDAHEHSMRRHARRRHGESRAVAGIAKETYANYVTLAARNLQALDGGTRDCFAGAMARTRFSSGVMRDVTQTFWQYIGGVSCSLNRV